MLRVGEGVAWRALLLLVLVTTFLASFTLAGRDFYKILGLKRNAKEKEIKKACALCSRRPLLFVPITLFSLPPFLPT